MDLSADLGCPPRRELLGPIAVGADGKGPRRWSVVKSRVEECAEFVALHVGERDALRSVFGEHPSAQLQQRLDIAGVEVQMHAVLHRLGSPLLAERQESALRRPTQGGRPEALDGPWLHRIDHQGPQRDGHTDALSRSLGSTNAERAATVARCRVTSASGASTVARLARPLSNPGRRLTIWPISFDSRTRGPTRGRRNAAKRANAAARLASPSTNRASTAASSRP